MKEKDTKVETEIKELKKTRKCSNIPARTFEDAMQLAQGIWECASGQKVRRLTLFDHLGKSPDSGHSRVLITSSSKYGITSGGYQADYIELTDNGRTASNPDLSNVDRIYAQFELAILSNEYFKGLYDSFKGIKMPTTQVLEDKVKELGINVDDAKSCVEIFTANAKYIGLIQVLSGAQRLLSIEHLLEEKSKELSGRGSEQVNSNQISLGGGGSISTNVAQTDNLGIGTDNVCFYITPIGEEDSDIRKHSDLMLENIVAPALEEFGLNRIVKPQRSRSRYLSASIITRHHKKVNRTV